MLSVFLSCLLLQLFIALSIGEFLPNRLVAPLYGTLCISWPLDEVCAAALSFIFYGERAEPRRLWFCLGFMSCG
jgi:hypothetical protein